MNTACGGEDKLIRHASHPIQDASHFGGAGLLAITRPIEGGEREFDQTGIDCGNPRELLAHLLKARAVMTEQEHPALRSFAPGRAARARSTKYYARAFHPM